MILTLSGETIFRLTCEVVEALEMYDIPVVSLPCDGAKPDRRFYKMCQEVMKDQPKSVPYKTFNPLREEKDDIVYFFCDAPHLHLLKTARNCFSKTRR